jgi:hypothetical protein
MIDQLVMDFAVIFKVVTDKISGAADIRPSSSYEQGVRAGRCETASE